MKTIITLTLVAAAAIAYWFYFTDHTETPIRHLHLNGTSQFLIGYANPKQQILYGGMHFPQDNFIINVYRHDGTRPCGNSAYCDYVNDSTLLTFDNKSTPFLMDVVTGGEKRLDIDFNFQDYELYNNIETIKDGFLFNTGDSVFMFNIKEKTSRNIFKTNPGEQIMNFDFSGGNSLVCVRAMEEYKIIFVDSAGKSHSLTESPIDLPFPPVVRWFNDEKYIANSYTDQSHILIKSINTDSTFFDFPIGNLQVLNFLAADGMLYMTVINEKKRVLQAKNPFKIQYSGLSIATIDLPAVSK